VLEVWRWRARLAILRHMLSPRERYWSMSRGARGCRRARIRHHFQPVVITDPVAVARVREILERRGKL
jgi:hypothetical protein